MKEKLYDEFTQSDVTFPLKSKKQDKSASGMAKSLGARSLAEVAALMGDSNDQNLKNWFKSKPDLFECVVIGATAKKIMNMAAFPVENTINILNKAVQDKFLRKGFIGRVYLEVDPFYEKVRDTRKRKKVIEERIVDSYVVAVKFDDKTSAKVINDLVVNYQEILD